MAHPYSTQAELAHHCGGAEGLVQIFDDDKDGVADPAAMATAIVDADSMIDAYINKQYLVPLNVVPDLIKHLSARIAVYTRRAAHRMVDPETHGKLFDADLATLKAIRDGAITLGDDPGPTKASARIDGQSDRPLSKDRSRRALRGFS